MRRIAVSLLASTVGLVAAVPLLAGQAAPSALTVSTPAPTTAAMRPTLPSHGYLAQAEMPDAMALVGPPPAPGSAVLQADQRGEQQALRARGSARWTLAQADADLWSPAATSALSCAAGVVISPATTPRLDQLLRKAAADLGLVSAPVKLRYSRPRPFAGNAQPTCTPELEAALRNNGSYPSGHATIGYGWALIVADLLPQRRTALLARGRAFGDSRRICNVHFRSDIAAGQALAAPVVARLQGNPDFRADLQAARAELRTGTLPKPSCQAERSALVEQ